MPLTLTAGQTALILSSDAIFDSLFASGDTSGVISPLSLYTAIPALAQQQTRLPMKSALAAFLLGLNFPGALSNGLTTTVTLAKLTTLGSNGSLTFKDGLLIAVVNPT